MLLKIKVVKAFLSILLWLSIGFAVFGEYEDPWWVPAIACLGMWAIATVLQVWQMRLEKHEARVAKLMEGRR